MSALLERGRYLEREIVLLLGPWMSSELELLPAWAWPSVLAKQGAAVDPYAMSKATQFAKELAGLDGSFAR